MKSLIRLLGVLCTLATSASAAPTLAAVFPVRARGIDSNSVRIVEEALADALMRTGKLRLVERSQMEAVLREQGFQESGACDASSCAVEMGKILGVQQGVISSLGRLGGSWVLNARLVDVGSGEILVSTQRTAAGSIDRAMSDLVPKVAEDLTAVDPGTGSPAQGVDDGRKRSGGLVWWTLGGIVVAGGATAAALVLSGDSGPAATPPVDPQADGTVPVVVEIP